MEEFGIFILKFSIRMKNLRSLALVTLLSTADAFVGPASSMATQRSLTSMSMVDFSAVAEVSNTVPAFVANSGLLVAETEAWVQPTALVLGPFLNFLSFAMVRELY